MPKPSATAERSKVEGISKTLSSEAASWRISGNSHAYLIIQSAERRGLTEGTSEARLGSGSASTFPICEALGPGDTITFLSDGVWPNLSPASRKEIVLRVAARKLSEVPNSVVEAMRPSGSADDKAAVAVRLLE